MGKTSWHGQIYRALKAIDHIGESKYEAKQAQGWKPGEAVAGIHSFGTFNAVFERAITYTNWLVAEYPGLELAMWLGHNPHRTEVTYAYVPKGVPMR